MAADGATGGLLVVSRHQQKKDWEERITKSASSPHSQFT
jgi:hypothetical protein